MTWTHWGLLMGAAAWVAACSEQSSLGPMTGGGTGGGSGNESPGDAAAGRSVRDAAWGGATGAPDAAPKVQPRPPDRQTAPVGVFVDILPWTPMITYRGDTGETGERHGPGGVFADLDADGYPDLVLVTGPERPVRLFVNVPVEGGLRGFEERAFDAGSIGGSTGAIAADYDNDGDLDVYVTHFGEPNQLYRNQLIELGTLGFIDVTQTTDPTPLVDDAQRGVAVGVDEGTELTYSLTAAWADVDRDGWVDLYVGNHNGSQGQPEYGSVPGERDVLYRNLGDGTFEDITEAAGATGWEDETGESITPIQRYASSNAVLFSDLNDDMWPDLIVTNKTRTPTDHDMIYLNRGAADGRWLGYENVVYLLPGGVGGTTPLAMGLDSGDLDGDGDRDVYVTDWAPAMSPETPNELWINRLAETSALDFQISPDAKGVFSWGVQMQDYDNDGRIDIHVSTNNQLADLFYHNEPIGLIDRAGELGLGNLRNSRGLMTADYDRDGFLDAFIVVVGGAPSLLYESGGFWGKDGKLNRFLSLKLVGDPTLPGTLRSTRDAIGATVVITADVNGDGRPVRMLREVLAGGSNAASTSSFTVEVGLGVAETADIEVRWPSGRTTTRSTVPAGQFMTVSETEGD